MQNRQHFGKKILINLPKGTRLEKLITSQKLQSSRYKVSHLSDVLRFSILWRFGGTYLDTDMIVLRPFPSVTSVPNFVVEESPKNFSKYEQLRSRRVLLLLIYGLYVQCK